MMTSASSCFPRRRCPRDSWYNAVTLDSPVPRYSARRWHAPCHTAGARAPSMPVRARRVARAMPRGPGGSRAKTPRDRIHGAAAVRYRAACKRFGPRPRPLLLFRLGCRVRLEPPTRSVPRSAQGDRPRMRRLPSSRDGRVRRSSSTSSSGFYARGPEPGPRRLVAQRAANRRRTEPPSVLGTTLSPWPDRSAARRRIPRRLSRSSSRRNHPDNRRPGSRGWPSNARRPTPTPPPRFGVGSSALVCPEGAVSRLRRACGRVLGARTRRRLRDDRRARGVRPAPITSIPPFLPSIPRSGDRLRRPPA